MVKTIKGITVKIGGDTTGLGKALESANSKTKDLQTELNRVNKLLKGDPKNTELLAQKQDILREAVANTSTKLRQLHAVQQQVNEQHEKGEIAEEQYRDFQREIVATEQKLKKLTKELNNFGSVGAQQAKVVGEKMQEAGNKIKKVGEGIEKVGQKLAPISGAAAGALVGATKGAIDFESAWAGVTKTVDESDEDMEALKQGILDLSQGTASSAEDIAAVMENAGQLGVKGKDNLLKFTEVMIRLGDSTNISSDEAATAIAKLYNIMGADLDTVDQFGASMVALGNNFATTENDIMNMATRLASAGNQLGLSQQEVLALATTLSSVGLEAEAGGSAISQVLTKIDMAVATNSEELKTWADLTGLSVSQFKQKWETDAMGAIQLVVGGLGDAKAGGENLNLILDELGITTIRQSDTMRRLSSASDLMTDAVNLSNQAWEENTALTNESDKRYETTAAKIQQLKGAITELCVNLGEILLPIVQNVVTKLQEWVNKFSELSPGTQKVILAITALVAGLSPVIIVIGKVVSAIGTITSAFGKLLTFTPKVVSGFNTLKTGALNAINLLKVGCTMSLNSLKSAGLTALNGLKSGGLTALNALKSGASTVLTAAKSVATTAFTAIKTVGTTAFTGLKTVATTALTGLKTVLSTVVTFAKTALSGLFKLILAHPVAAVVAAVVALLIVLYNKCEWFRDGVNNVVKKIGEFVKKIPGFFQELPGKVVSIGKNIMDGLLSGIRNGWDSLKRGISGICDSVVGWFQSKLKINSPSKVIADKIGKGISEGLGYGVEQNEDEAIKPMNKVMNRMISGVSPSMSHDLQDRLASGAMSVTSTGDGTVLGKLDKILTAIEKGQIIALDGKALVGGTVNAYDTALGQRRMLAARGAV